jgi:hypothetical protein
VICDTLMEAISHHLVQGAGLTLISCMPFRNLRPGTGGVAQVVDCLPSKHEGPEFKLQGCQKKDKPPQPACVNASPCRLEAHRLETTI